MDAIPFGLGHVEERRAGEDAGVVDQRVDGTHPALSRVDERGYVGRAGDVALHGEAATSGLADLLGDACRGVRIVQVVEHDVGPFARERKGDRPADPLLPARDQRDRAAAPHRQPPFAVGGFAARFLAAPVAAAHSARPRRRFVMGSPPDDCGAQSVSER